MGPIQGVRAPDENPTGLSSRAERFGPCRFALVVRCSVSARSVCLAALMMMVLLPAASASAAVCPGVSDAYSAAVLADSPSAYYRLDESAGPTLCDSSSSAAHGTYDSGVTYGVGGALTASSDTAVGVGASSSGIGTGGPGLTGNQSFTLEAWFRSTGTTQNQAVVAMGTAAQGKIAGLTTWSNVSTSQFGPSVGTLGPSEIGLDTYSSSNHWDTASAGVDIWDQQWHYLAVTYDQSANQVVAYVDGHSLGPETPTALNLGASSILVGKWVDTTINQRFIGNADEVAVYPSALSAARVAAHVAASGSTFTTSSTSTSSSSTSTKRPSATSVQCNYDSFMQSFSCTAQVGDASGVQPPQTPTGTVAFALDPGAGGSFPQGSSCTLQPSTFGPTAFCSVTYVPGQQGAQAGTQPSLSATYSGDSIFASSSGRPTNQYGVGPIFVPTDTTSTSSTTSSSSTSSSTSTTTRTVATSTTTTSKPTPHCNASGHAARDFYAAVKLSTARTLTAGGHAPRRAPTLSRAQADRRAVALLHPSRAPLANGVTLYGLPQPLTAGSVITEARLGFARRLLPALRIRERAWLYWENLGPLERYMHPSVVLVIAAKGGRVLARAKFLTYPEVNGRPATFVRSRHARVLYQRGPGRRHPIKLSNAELARLRTAQAVSRVKVLAHTSDVSKSTLITLVNHGSDQTQAFADEQLVMTKAFQSHGVPTANTSSLADMAGAVGRAAASGRTTVTLFIDGHGAPSSATTQPEISLGDEADEYITARDLTAITQAYPNIKFNFIIDSCFSGRFVNPLAGEPNVASITTSSNADQESSGSVKITTSPTSSTGKPLPPLQEATGQKLYVAGNDNGEFPVSSFTAGEVAALKQSWIDKGPQADVTTVLEDARTLEPTYDLAAQYGKTTPSPDPFSAGTMCGQDSPGTPDPSPPDDWFIAS